MTQPTEPRRTRRATGWADVPAMEPPPADEVELLGLNVVATVLNQMREAERQRTLRWLVDRYGPTVHLGDRDEP